MAAEKVGLEAVLDLRKFNLAYSSYVSKLSSMNSITGSTASRLTSQFTDFGKSLLKIAAILSGAVVAGAALAGAALAKMAVTSIKDAAELEQQIANIAATMNMTTKEAGFLKDVIIDLGLDPQLRVTTFEAAQAMDLLAKNGVFAGQSIQEMEETARNAGKAVVLLANATGAEFGQAADIATDAMILFNRSSAEMIDIVSGITAVTTNSKFTIDDYELALRNGGAAAALAGLSLEDFNTIITATAEELGKGRKAGTGLLNFMNRLTPNSEKATQAMKDLGLITEDGTNRFFDMNGELKDGAAIAEILNQSLFGTHKIVSEVSNRTAEQNALLGELNAEYNDARETIDYYTNGIGALLATEDEKNAAISEAEGIIEKLTPKMDELNGISSDYVTTLQSLTTEQRMVALETIFGNDAMKTAIGIGKEGARVTGDLTRVTRAFGVSMSEAAMMVEDGLTEYELLQQEMSKTDAVQNAETRMDTLSGKIEILGGIVEAFRINFGSQFLDLFTAIAEKAQELADNEEFGEFIENLGSGIATFIESLINGKGVLESFQQFLTDIGQGDLASRIQEIVTSIDNFVTPIINFVQNHADAFIGALKGIGIALLGIMGFTVVAAALSALLSPVGLLIVAAGLLGAAWESNFMNIQEVTRNVVSSVTSFLDEIGVLEFVDDLKSAFDAGGLRGLGQEIPKALSKLGSNISDSVRGWFDGIDWAEVGMTVVENLMSAMQQAGEGLGNLVNVFTEWVLSVDWENVGSLIVDALIAAIGFSIVRFAAIGQFLISALTTIDWANVALSIIKVVGGIIVGAFERLSEYATLIGEQIQLNVIDPMKAAFEERKNEFVESAQENIANAIISGIETIKEKVIEPLANLWNTMVAWFHGITWEDLGYWVTTAVLNVLVGFPVTILETLGTWWQTFWDWVTLTDWESVGNDVITRIDTKLKEFGALVLLTLAKWWLTISNWFTERPWESQGEEVNTRINDALKKFWETAKATFDGWWVSIKGWWDSINWNSLGTDIMNGIISGIEQKAQDAVNAIKGVGRGVQDAWNDFWDAHSPSHVMVASGANLIESVSIGMGKQAQMAMETATQIGNNLLSGFSGTIENVLPNSPVVANAPQQVSNLTENNFSVNNDFLGNPQVTDANSLKYILSGFT